MRIAFCYPPIPSPKGTPLLSQNRQFQWFSDGGAIYPVVPAHAASLLRTHGHTILWRDGIAQKADPKTYLEELISQQPDVVFVETKTPVANFHLQWIRELKGRLPACRVVLAGDHANAFPDELKKLAPVDHVIRGGNYDFALLSWIEGREIPVDLATLPPIDRELTRWRDYAEKNGNFLRTPGAYIMAGRDCWHGKCTFCSWATLYPNYRVRPVGDVLDEIGELIQLGVREIMDDTGCFPIGRWLTDFCEGMIARGYNKKVRLNCNMRFGALNTEGYRLMRRAGFRMVLFGVESANQGTLDRLEKNLTVEAIERGAREASQAGLHVHITLMFGYPWEDATDAKRTADFARKLLRKGYARTLQATWLVPYPGTPLFKELKATDGLLTENWEAYDMRAPVMKSPLTEDEIREWISYTYRGFFQLPVIIRHGLAALTTPAYLLRGLRSLLGHLRDFA